MNHAIVDEIALLSAAAVDSVDTAGWIFPNYEIVDETALLNAGIAIQILPNRGIVNPGPLRPVEQIVCTRLDDFRNKPGILLGLYSPLGHRRYLVGQTPGIHLDFLWCHNE